VRSDSGDARGFGIGLDELPDDFFAEALAGYSVGAIYRAENVTIRDSCR